MTPATIAKVTPMDMGIIKAAFILNRLPLSFPGLLDQAVGSSRLRILAMFLLMLVVTVVVVGVVAAVVAELIGHASAFNAAVRSADSIRRGLDNKPGQRTAGAADSKPGEEDVNDDNDDSEEEEHGIHEPGIPTVLGGQPIQLVGGVDDDEFVAFNGLVVNKTALALKLLVTGKAGAGTSG